ncbi:hypothetical protein TNCV_293841 [Trichonephila clavipes]|nr:hypothetical protein TNCV_293841 [Trichonephila clavipes]
MTGELNFVNRVPTEYPTEMAGNVMDSIGQDISRTWAAMAGLLAKELVVLNLGQAIRTTARVTSQKASRSSLGVKVKDSRPACREFELGTAEHPPGRVGRYTLNMSTLECPSLVWKLGEEGVPGSDVVLVTRPRFKITRAVAKIPRVGE